MKEFDYDKISRYIDGEMTVEETAVFETEMQQDAELKAEVLLYRDVEGALKTALHPSAHENELRQTMQGLNEEFFAEQGSKAKVIPLKRTRWISALAAVLVMGLFLTIWSPWKKDNLFDTYAATEMPGVEVRGQQSDSLLKEAAVQFNAKKFAEAVPLFEGVLKADAQNSFAQYYYAIALLQTGQVEKSRNLLTQLYNSSSVFHTDAAFYIALGYLKEKNKPECKTWLEKITEGAGTYEKARALLKKL